MKTNEDKIYSFLGLATRAGKIVSGDDSTLLELKRGNVKLVIVAEDASDNTKKLFKDKLLSLLQIGRASCRERV